MDRVQFELIKSTIDGLNKIFIDTQKKQEKDNDKIFEKLTQHGEKLAVLETKIDGINCVKTLVEKNEKLAQENAKKISVLRGVGIGISAVFSFLLYLFGIR